MASPKLSLRLIWLRPNSRGAQYGFAAVFALFNTTSLDTAAPNFSRSKLPLCAKRCEKGCVQSTRQSHLTCILCLIQHASLKLHIVNLSTILIPYSVRVYPKVSYSYTVHTGTYRCIYVYIYMHLLKLVGPNTIWGIRDHYIWYMNNHITTSISYTHMSV